jgi:probable selenate reductase FAD-binding subunit
MPEKWDNKLWSQDFYLPDHHTILTVHIKKKGVYPMLKYLEEYHRPQDLKQALQLLHRKEIPTHVLAGGTDLVLSKSPNIKAVIDISSLGLDEIVVGDDVVRLGAMVRLQTLVSDERFKTLAQGRISEAARMEGTYAIRNLATVGGTVAVSDATSELTTMLLAAGASVEINGDEGEKVSLEEMLEHKGKYIASNIITAVEFPNPNGWGFGLWRVARLQSVEPILVAAAAVRKEKGKPAEVRLALGGVHRRPIRVREMEKMLVQAGSLDGMVSAIEKLGEMISPRGNIRASAEYRKEVAPVAARRALTMAWEA